MFTQSLKTTFVYNTLQVKPQPNRKYLILKLWGFFMFQLVVKHGAEIFTVDYQSDQLFGYVCDTILYAFCNIICLLSGVRSMHSTDIQWSAILSWGYADNILRLKSKQSEPPVNFIQSSQFHQVKKISLLVFNLILLVQVVA